MDVGRKWYPGKLYAFAQVMGCPCVLEGNLSFTVRSACVKHNVGFHFEVVHVVHSPPACYSTEPLSFRVGKEDKALPRSALVSVILSNQCVSDLSFRSKRKRNLRGAAKGVALST